MAAVERDRVQRLAEGMSEHLAIHSAYLPAPQGYQFDIGDGHFVLMHDLHFGARRSRGRTLVVSTLQPVVGGRVIRQMYPRPRRIDRVAP